MPETQPTPETTANVSSPLLKAQQVVEKAREGLKTSLRSKAIPIALAGSLLFTAACGISSNTNVDANVSARPAVVATATAEPTVQAPVAVEQGGFNEDFWHVTRAVQELIRPETLKENPDLNYNLAFYPDKLRQASDKGAFIEQKQPPTQGHAGWRRVIFRPEQDKGQTAIYVTEDERGRIYNIAIHLNVTADGKHKTGGLEDWSTHAIQDDDLPKVMTQFFNTPEGVDLKWKKETSSSGIGYISGSADVEGRHYYLFASTTGSADFSVSYDPNKSPILNTEYGNSTDLAKYLIDTGKSIERNDYQTTSEVLDRLTRRHLNLQGLPKNLASLSAILNTRQFEDHFLLDLGLVKRVNDVTTERIIDPKDYPKKSGYFHRAYISYISTKPAERFLNTFPANIETYAETDSAVGAVAKEEIKLSLDKNGEIVRKTPQQRLVQQGEGSIFSSTSAAFRGVAGLFRDAPPEQTWEHDIANKWFIAHTQDKPIPVKDGRGQNKNLVRTTTFIVTEQGDVSASYYYFFNASPGK